MSDFTLQTKDGATVLNAILASRFDPATGQPSGKAWRRFRGKPFADAFRTDQNGATDPTKELFFYQTDWSEGALIGTYTPGSKGYRTGSFMPAGGKLVRGLGKNLGSDRGNNRSVIGVALANPGFEATGATDWVDLTGGTLTLAATANPRTTMAGSQHMRIVAAGSGQGAKVVVTDHTDWRGREIKFAAYLTRSTGSTNGIKLTIDDGVGTSNSSTITASSYTLATATHTVDGSSTKLEFIIQSTGSDTFDADDATVYSGTNLSPTKIVHIADGIYCAFGRMMCKLDVGTTNKFKWEPVYIHATAEFTDIEAYKNRIYGALGYSTNYIYSDSGSGDATAKWTSASGGGNKAKHFVELRHELWRSVDDGTIDMSTTDPETGTNWGSDFEVGNHQEPITRLHSAFDTIWVGKQAGYYSYRRFFNDGTAANDFINQVPGSGVVHDSDAFSRGVADPAGRYFYVKIGRSGLMRHTDQAKERIGTHFVLAEDALGGRIGALARDTNNVYIFADDQLYMLPTDDVTPMPMPAPTIGQTGNTLIEPSQVNSGALSPSTASGSGTAPNNVKTSDDNRDELTSSTSAVDIYLHFDGSQVGNTKSTTAPTITSDATFTLGSSSDVWGTALTALNINDSTFGVIVNQPGSNGDNVFAHNFGFSIPITDSINGIKVDIEWRAGITQNTIQIDHITITVYHTPQPTESAGIYVKEAATQEWTVDSVSRPHLLGIISGLDSTDSQPYAWTDCWALSLNAAIPDLDDINIGDPNPFWRSSTWDGGEEFADVVKAIDSVTVRFKGMDGTETVNFTLGADGQDGGAVAVGTFGNTDNVQTLYTNDMTSPETQAIGKSFIFGLDASSAPKGFAVESILVRGHATQARETLWEFDILTGGGILETGLEDVQSVEETINLLETLEDSAYPIELVEDLRETGSKTTHTIDIVPDSIEEIDSASDVLGARAGTIRFQVRKRKVS